MQRLRDEILRYDETGVFSVRSVILSSSFLTNLQEAGPWVLPVSLLAREFAVNKEEEKEEEDWEVTLCRMHARPTLESAVETELSRPLDLQMR